MSIFLESGFLFTFAEDWNVIKFDEHRFYKRLSGRSFKGIDFAGVYKDETLYLIEVKNYKQYAHTVYDVDVEMFCQEIVKKIKDSISLIQIIHLYYTRKWVYRAFFPIVRRYPFMQREWFFWTTLYDLCFNKEKVRFVLCIDSDFDNEDIAKKLEASLRFQNIGISIENISDQTLPGLRTNDVAI